MEYPWAAPGVKVVCIDAYIPPMIGSEHEHFDPLDKGGIYTIEEVMADEHGVWLGLIERPDDQYTADHFRPLIDHDLAKFTHLLNTQKIEERA